MDLKFETVGVGGAGVMGQGLAQVLAQTGHKVLLVDVDDGILDSAQRQIVRSLKLAAMMNRNSARVRTDDVVSLITPTTDISRMGAADFIIENATEDFDIKRGIYRALDRVADRNCVIAANTSAIPIGNLALELRDRSRLVGMHFMNPVPQKRIVEVVQGPDTSGATIESARALLHEIGKEAILVNDSPGFVTNRVLMLTINEAIAVVNEGVANAVDTDRIFIGCFAHAMGPLATADLIGLDTIMRSLEVLQTCFGEARFTPNPLLVEMVSSGKLGRKSGLGFYDYRVKGDANGRS